MSSCSARPAFSAVFLLLLGFSSGSVIPLAGRIDASQVRIQDELGQYHFAHVGGPNSREETRVADGSTVGSYSYVDGNGLIQSAAYVADPVNGFRVAATNLPAGPAVPAGSPELIASGLVAPTLIAGVPAPLVLSGPAIASPAVVARISEPAPAGEAQSPEEPQPEEPRSEEPATSTESAPASGESSSTAAPENPSPAPAQEANSEEPAPAPVNPFVPVQDTPEVIAARQQHLAAFQETQARDAASGTEDSSSGEPTETPETPEPTEPSSSPAPESSSEQPQPPALIPAAVPTVHLAGHFPAVPVAPIAPVAAVAGPALARVAAVAAPSVAAVALPAPGIAIADATQYRVQDELGQYAFGHAGGPNAREEIRTADGITRGGYAYVDGNGLIQSANYLADPVNGFRVAATNLPVQPVPSYIPDSPEVAEAKAALLRAQQEHIAKL